ncbi:MULTISPECIES: hypothetical protein [unclassified Campylobacter]|uniref:hypothetical protein n=1 Tax=unclassified Campylobacter TaxID=2593542 RepID=UPI0022E9B0D3|nr:MULTISPECIES: hypothetical protein [unclassified Campylobacter]MDA3048214.1 hypothetical protein [Campylobacter sp. JMF_08 NE1]MDA3055004.1 hypothetical protein [Campylobacter sp. VBCF_07 NA4]MDA3060506.1 hypothetical protein [Campylobacter sp. VBCF_02 NA5]MDA3070228.1 hypothetical protein [Campylobacter sp. VBCF_08 NA3]WBR54661.1 hypothetical protein PF027_01965 [Campylobacter sp. VBCF_01 NA2]
MLSKEQLEMFEKASAHMTKMENDPEYCKEIEKELYKGAPSWLLNRIKKRISESEKKDEKKKH